MFKETQSCRKLDQREAHNMRHNNTNKFSESTEDESQLENIKKLSKEYEEQEIEFDK